MVILINILFNVLIIGSVVIYKALLINGWKPLALQKRSLLWYPGKNLNKNYQTNTFTFYSTR